MRKYGALALTLGAALALSACGTAEELPKPVAATLEARPAISTERLGSVQEVIFDSVQNADAKLDAKMLEERTTGPFTQMRGAEYKLKKILADSFGLERLSTVAQQTAVSPADSYPHTALSIMEAPQGSNLQTIDVFQQATARDNWMLWGVMDILPGATVPALTVKDEGASLLDSTSADGLVASPEDVLAAYSSLNDKDDAQGLTFAEDRLRQTLSAGKESNKTAVEGAGEATMSFKSASEPTISFGTEDGGALVVGQMNLNTQIKVTTEGAKIKLQSTIGTLGSGKAGGEIEVSGTMVADYTVLVAFHVPAADSKDKTIQVVGASDPVLLSVSNG
ncbi:MAG: hypothetical protein U0P48_14380 [Ancrocorticia sp.]